MDPDREKQKKDSAKWPIHLFFDGRMKEITFLVTENLSFLNDKKIHLHFSRNIF